MNRKRWYLIMLFLPLLVPVLLLGAAAVFGYKEVIVSVGMLIRLLFISSLIAGIPYGIFAMAFALWCRDCTADKIRKLSWWLPWMFTPVCGLFFWVAFSREYPDGDGLEGALLMMAFCVPIGFLYVFTVHALTKLAIMLKIVKV